ncbi:MAG: hypothetical protein ACTHNU_13535 [Gaiellales bacterium]
MNRRSLVKRAGAAVVGATALGAAGASPAGADERAQMTDPSGPVPAEPVVAYVRDADRGEVTVAAGGRETTYRDRALVKRLLRAARREGVV